MSEHEKPMVRWEIKKKRFYIPDNEKKRLYFDVKDKKAYNYGYENWIEEEDERTITEKD